jgi:hypothetical protein
VPVVGEGQEPWLRAAVIVMPVQRRARDRDGSIIQPMTLANMRENGVGSILATCETCEHDAVLHAEKWPADMPVPDIGLKLRCSICGGREIATRPNWRDRKRGA